MNNNYAHVTVVLDKSGSMSGRTAETISSYNKLVDDQKIANKHITFSLFLFNHEIDVVYSFVDIGSVKELTAHEYAANGYTALNDAVGRAIDETGVYLAGMQENERPSKVLLVVITDGFENASKEFTGQNIIDKVKHQREKYGWEVMFIGCDEEQVKNIESSWELTSGFAMATMAKDLAHTVGYRTSRLVTNFVSDSEKA